jgi:hypothetical protein
MEETMRNPRAAWIAAVGLALVSALAAAPVMAAAPAVSLSTSALAFGPEAWQQSAPSQTIVVTNTGDAALSVQTVDISGQPFVPEDFFLSSDRCSSSFTTIAPGATCQISVGFKPQSGGPRTATLSIFDNASGSPQQVSLDGQGTGAVIGFSPALLEFGTVAVGTTSAPLPFTVINAGDGAVTISNAAIDPIDAHAGFAIAADACYGTTLGPGQRCSISATVTPSAVGETGAQLDLFDNAGTGEQKYGANITALDATGGGAQLAILSSQSSFTQGAGTTSAPSRFQVFDSGTLPLVISSVGLDNPAAGFSIVSDACSGATLPVPVPFTTPQTCEVDVVFGPATAGSFLANLVFQTNEFSHSLSQVLTGTAFAPVAVLSTNTIDFGLQASGTTSSPRTVTVTNPSPQSLSITSASLGGSNPSFFQKSSDSCTGTTLAQGAVCSIAVTFAPPFPFPLSATLSIADNAPGNPQVVSLLGEGQGTAFTISTSHLSFGSLHANTASAPLTVTVTNTSATTMSYGHLMNTAGSVTGCTSLLSPGASCTLSVSLTPSSVGPQTGRLTIADSANNALFVLIDWTGTSGAAFLEDGLINNQLIQTVGTSKSVTAELINSGTDVLNVGQVTFTSTAPVAISGDGCSHQAIPSGGICTFVVTVTPTALGGSFTSVTVPSDAVVGPNPATLQISGWAAAVTQPVTSPASVTFPSQHVGAAEGTQTIWFIDGLIPSLGAQTTTIASVVLAGADASSFRIVFDGCSSLPVPPAFSCPVSVGFDPAAGRTFNASLVFNDDAVGSPQVVPLSGLGLAPAASLSPQQLDFGSVQVGQQSQPQSVTLTNSGNFQLNVVSVATTAGAPFTVGADTCTGAAIAPGGSCSVAVTFAPSARGAFTLPLTFTDDAPGSPQQVTLTGQAVVRQLTVSPASLNLGQQPVGSTDASTQQMVTVANSGPDPVDLSGITVSPGFAIGTQTCPAGALAPGASCTIGVYATPTAVGPYAGQLTIADDATGAPQTVALSAVGLGGVLSLSPASVDFGSVTVNSKSAPVTVTVTNAGNIPITISRETITGSFKGEYTITSESCQNQTLAPGASCQVTLVFRPEGLGSRPATLTFTDFALNAPQSVPLNGTGKSK